MLIKKIVFFVFIIVSIIIINDLGQSILTLWQRNELLERNRHVLMQERKNNAELKRRLTIVTAPKFIEEEARNKLFLVKPREGIVVLAPTTYLQISSSAGLRGTDTRPYWKQWWEAFF